MEKFRNTYQFKNSAELSQIAAKQKSEIRLTNLIVIPRWKNSNVFVTMLLLLRVHNEITCSSLCNPRARQGQLIELISKFLKRV